MTTHSRSLFAATALAFFLIGCTKRPASDLHRVELTKEDIVSLFNIPVDQSRMDKFEWSFDREHYVRAVIERSDDRGGTWREAATFPRNIAVRTATLIYKLDPLGPTGPSPYRYILHLRLGGRNIGSSGWTGSDQILDLPEGQHQTESHFDDPARIFVISSGSRIYRLRLEAQDKSFAHS